MVGWMLIWSVKVERPGSHAAVVEVLDPDRCDCGPKGLERGEDLHGLVWALCPPRHPLGVYPDRLGRGGDWGGRRRR